MQAQARRPKKPVLPLRAAAAHSSGLRSGRAACGGLFSCSPPALRSFGVCASMSRPSKHLAPPTAWARRHGPIRPPPGGGSLPGGHGGVHCSAAFQAATIQKQKAKNQIQKHRPPCRTALIRTVNRDNSGQKKGVLNKGKTQHVVFSERQKHKHFTERKKPNRIMRAVSIYSHC